MVDEEPAAAFSPEILGLLAALGIEKGKPFAPDERLRETLVEAVLEKPLGAWTGDQPIGVIAGTLPFGGARLSGTNDKISV